MSDVWYVGVNGQQQGPISKQALGDMIRRGEINRQSIVWRDGIPGGNWTAIESVPELADILPKMPPPMPKASPPPMPAAASVPYTPSAPAATMPGASPAAPPRTGSRRVLIITDSMFIGKQLGTILSSEGHQVVDDIREIDQGIQKYAELYSGIDGVFLDIRYENRIEDIMKINRRAHIISIIKADDNDAARRCVFNGSAAYIHKPVDRKEVLVCMSRI